MIDDELQGVMDNALRGIVETALSDLFDFDAYGAEQVEYKPDPTVSTGQIIVISVPGFIDDYSTGEVTYGDAQLGTFVPWLMERFAPRANRCEIQCDNDQLDGLEIAERIAVKSREYPSVTLFEAELSDQLLETLMNLPWSSYQRFPFMDLWFKNGVTAVLSFEDFSSEVAVYDVTSVDVEFVRSTLPSGLTIEVVK